LCWTRSRPTFNDMWRIRLDENADPGRWIRYTAGQPGWVIKWTLIAALVVIVVPLAVLALAGVVVGFVVFVLLALFVRLVAIVRAVIDGVLPSRRRDGRRNVRVIDRD